MPSQQRVENGESITDAINRAESGGTIIIAAGLYREHVQITKPITITGDRSNGAVELWPDSGAGLRIASKQVLIRELRLRMTMPGPIISVGHGELFLHKCELVGGSPAAVTAEGGATLRITECVITNGAGGVICTEEVLSLHLEDSTIRGHKGTGLILKSISGSVLITSCEISGNTGTAIIDAGPLGSTITDCDIHHNSGGIEVHESGPTIDRCNIHHNTGTFAGVTFSPGTYGRVRHCQLSNLGSNSAIWLEQSKANVMSTHIHDTGTGVWIEGDPVTKNIISDCDIHDTSFYGIVVHGAAPRLSVLKIHSCEMGGILIAERAHPEITGGHIHHNHGPGIEVEQGGGGTLGGHCIIHSNRDQIYEQPIPALKIAEGANFIISSCSLDEPQDEEMYPDP